MCVCVCFVGLAAFLFCFICLFVDYLFKCVFFVSFVVVWGQVCLSFVFVVVPLFVLNGEFTCVIDACVLLIEITNDLTV